MLVLTRGNGEKIVIDDRIVITVLHVKRGQIRIGIEAPADVPVYREEIWWRIQEAQKSNIA